MFSYSRLLEFNEYYAAKLISLLFYQCVNELELDQQIEELMCTTDGREQCRRAFDYLNEYFRRSQFTFNKKIESERRLVALNKWSDTLHINGSIPYTERDKAIERRQVLKPDKGFYKTVANKLESELSKHSSLDCRI